MDLNFKVFGQGDPVIILHGLFGTLDNWQTFAKQLSETHSVYILDQRNHGRSPHVDTLSYPEMADDLAKFMQTQGMFQATVLGHSMGGKTAMQFALNHPDLLEKLIVVDIAPKAYAGGHESIFEALLSLNLTEMHSRSDAEAYLAPRIPERGVRQFLLKNFTRDKAGGYVWKMNLPAIHRAYPNILDTVRGESESYDGPTLFVRGGKSRYVQDEDVPVIRRYFPNMRLETVAEAGHWVHAEAPDRLLRIVRTFLEEEG